MKQHTKDRTPPDPKLKRKARKTTGTFNLQGDEKLGGTVNKHNK